MPGGPYTRFEVDLRALRAVGIEGIEERINANRSGEPAFRAFRRSSRSSA